jgi:hypothetical protein
VRRYIQGTSRSIGSVCSTGGGRHVRAAALRRRRARSDTVMAPGCLFGSSHRLRARVRESSPGLAFISCLLTVRSGFFPAPRPLASRGVGRFALGDSSSRCMTRPPATVISTSTSWDEHPRNHGAYDSCNPMYLGIILIWLGSHAFRTRCSFCVRSVCGSVFVPDPLCRGAAMSSELKRLKSTGGTLAGCFPV